jgi:hypothetical protein
MGYAASCATLPRYLAAFSAAVFRFVAVPADSLEPVEPVRVAALAIVMSGQEKVGAH